MRKNKTDYILQIILQEKGFYYSELKNKSLKEIKELYGRVV